MIANICLIAGVCLVIWGILAMRSSGKGGGGTTSTPERGGRNTERSNTSIRHNQPSYPEKPAAPPLPPRRRNTTINTANTRSSSANLGPRGLRPSQFPCCPFCKRRNVLGSKQEIFWDSKAGNYYCSKRHKFKSNGKPL